MTDDLRFWLITAGWLLLVAVILRWIWRQVKHVDDQIELAEARQDELIEEMESFNRAANKGKARKLGLLDDEQNREWEGSPFSLDEQTHPHPKDAA